MDKSLKEIATSKNIRFMDIAEFMGVDKSTITRWAQKRVPAERVLKLAAHIGVKPSILRPDLFGK